MDERNNFQHLDQLLHPGAPPPQRMQLQRVQYLPFHLLDHLEVCRPCQRRQDGRLQPDDRRPPQGVLTQQRQLPESVAGLQVPDLPPATSDPRDAMLGRRAARRADRPAVDDHLGLAGQDEKEDVPLLAWGPQGQGVMGVKTMVK